MGEGVGQEPIKTQEIAAGGLGSEDAQTRSYVECLGQRYLCLQENEVGLLANDLSPAAGLIGFEPVQYLHDLDRISPHSLVAAAEHPRGAFEQFSQ